MLGSGIPERLSSPHLTERTLNIVDTIYFGLNANSGWSKVFNTNELRYTNLENGLYLSILGKVFDVTKGENHLEELITPSLVIRLKNKDAKRQKPYGNSMQNLGFYLSEAAFLRDVSARRYIVKIAPRTGRSLYTLFIVARTYRCYRSISWYKTRFVGSNVKHMCAPLIDRDKALESIICTFRDSVEPEEAIQKADRKRDASLENGSWLV
ncbi:hypothetical protein DBV15_09758 [Temnothorax longispinosus]|uniref:Uncharacterized protein n=1 Tax=Temnothorax longispinosus TaxID=300112 RepID=A0A4S2L0R9_9HYME|nr:hypothetical protein DBV15_09758 [Temnothorax longispinosus]